MINFPENTNKKRNIQPLLHKDKQTPKHHPTPLPPPPPKTSSTPNVKNKEGKIKLKQECPESTSNYNKTVNSHIPSLQHIHTQIKLKIKQY